MPLWADSLTVAGLACLTFGTGAQAWAFRTEFSILNAALTEAKRAGADQAVETVVRMVSLSWALMMGQFSIKGLALMARYLAGAMFWSVLRWRWYARRILATEGEEAVELARLLRQATVWAVLTLGSALVLAGAVVVLVHDV